MKGNQLWQPSSRNCRGVRREKIGIVTTKLPKMGGEKKKKREFWQSSCRKLGKKFNMQKNHYFFFFLNKQIITLNIHSFIETISKQT